jgi:general secretion pathway protein D
MLAGLIRDDERKSMSGIPGLSDIPVVGKLFSYSHTETLQSDIILTLTPHIVRVLDLNESDLRAFRVGRDSLAPISDLPLPVELPRPAPDVASPPAPAPDSTPPAPAPSGIPPATTIPPPTSRLPGE